MNKRFERWNQKYRRFAISNLMTYIVVGMAAVFLTNLISLRASGISLSALFSFDRALIFKGQVWRAITFIFIPPAGSIISLILSLYFYWLIGSALENQWGSFKFTVFYGCGVLGAIISGLITGYATNSYLNLSLFLAFAILYPDFEVNLMFVLPIKMKYLALLAAAAIIYLLVIDTWSGRLAMVFALANLLLFFWNDMTSTIKNAYRRYQFKKSMRS